MLCCVSRKAAAAAAERDFGCPRSLLFPPDTCQIIAQTAKDFQERRQLETCVEEEDVPPILLPCATCTRTFMPESLEKHKKICERTAIKKRKPFDSAKQRIQGTELAEFLPKQEKRRSSQDDNFHRKAKSSWKDTHNEFIQAIRAARGDTVDPPSHRQNVPVVSTGAPTRAYEKGACPTCKRQFGIKSYERHVEWCKEKATRVPLSPATNIAKERLEARMKYRAPVLKNRRAITREKYSPSGGGGSATSMGSSKTSPSSTKPKESSSLPSCNRNNEAPGKQKPAVPRRPAQNNREPLSSGPMKSRPADRGNSGNNKAYDPFAIADRQMIELFSDTSEQSSLDLTPEKKSTNNDSKSSPFPLSHSSAFVKYPKPAADKRTSLIAPPTEFDDLTSDFSSDSAETISRELFLKDNSDVDVTNDRKSKEHVFSRRVIIDKSAALGTDITDSSLEKSRKSVGKVSPKVVRPTFSRSNSVRSSSASSSISDRKSFASSIRSKKTNTSSCIEENLNNRNNNNYMSGSNLSLSSIVSSEIDIKRSNSVFDEFMSSFEDDNVSSNFPSLRSLLKNDSSFSSPPERQTNGQISDEDLSSPDSYKKSQDHGKLSADSAYSSLNRKYSNHGRSTTDVANRHNEDVQLKQRENDKTPTIRCKMSKFCHECGSKFPETAKFCCECGVKRLTL